MHAGAIAAVLAWSFILVLGNKYRNEVLLQNQYGRPVSLYWINNGEESFVRRLGHEEQFMLHTSINHDFVVRNEGGDEVRTFTVIQGQKELKIEDETQSEDDLFRMQYRMTTGRDWINSPKRDVTTYPIRKTPTIGHEHEIELRGEKRRLRVASTQPRILVMDDFLSSDECDYIIEEVKQKKMLRRSLTGTDAESNVDKDRTSSNTWLFHDHSPQMRQIVERSFQLLGIPYNEGNSSRIAEAMQVIHYDKTQKYREHYDYFPPTKAKFETSNRLATVFFYLNDVNGGGETYFPRFGGKYSVDGCGPNGFKVKPKKGSVAVFYSMLPDGNLDINSLHGSCPVLHGEKWGANLWFWDPLFR